MSTATTRRKLTQSKKMVRMYYAFYAPTQSNPAQKKGSASAHWSGDVELRGLAAKTYRIADYVHHKEFGTIARTTRQAEGGLHG